MSKAGIGGNRRAIVALVALCLIWGYSWIWMKIALHYAGAYSFAAMRTGVAAASLFGLLLLLRRDLRLRAPRVVLAFSVFQGVFILFTLLALTRGAVGRVSVLNFTMPFWVVLLAWPALGERLRAVQWAVIALAFCGLIAVAQPWELGDKLLSATLATCAGLSWAAGTLVVKHYREELAGMDPLALTAWPMLLSLAPLTLLAWVVPERPLDWTWQLASVTALLGVLGTALAWWLWLYVVTHLSTPVASLNTLAIPALALLLAWLHFGERPNAFEAIGMVLIAAALIALSRLGRR